MTEGSEGSEGDIFDQAITRRETQMLLPSFFPSFSLFLFFLFIFLFFLLLSLREQGSREGCSLRGEGRAGTIR